MKLSERIATFDYHAARGWYNIFSERAEQLGEGPARERVTALAAACLARVNETEHDPR